MPVLLPIDHLAELWPDKLRDVRIGALLHPASVNSKLEHTSQILERENGKLFQLRAFFGPQHGYRGETQDNMIEWQSYEHPRLGIPVYSLYAEQREPKRDMLQDLDLLLVDLQDIGARYYTFVWTMYLAMRACERENVRVVVLDRPNPINGVTVEGPPLNPDYRSFVGMHPIPVRHGKTIGELAAQFRDEAFPKCRLTVLSMKNWEREVWFDQTGLHWVIPSPNMPTLETATVYPGMCLLEGTNLSEGRGTSRPFEIFGAPWIDSEKLCRELNALKLPGTHFRETFFQPTFQKFASELCGGAQLHLIDRDSFRPFETGIEVIRCIRRMYANHFQWKSPPYEYEFEKLPIEVLLGGPVSEFFPRLTACTLLSIALPALAENREMAMDKMTDAELRAFREQRVAELKQRARDFRPEQLADGDAYPRIFFCTIYYTPKESGFTADRGFDATPVGAAGLRGRKYPRDFLLAVKKEGFGRINETVDGRNYIRWIGDNRYAFAGAPVGRRGEVLVPRRSCAISSRNKFLRQHTRLRIKSQTVNDETGSDEWFVCDTGPGVHPLQIDLYWGEDEPRGSIGRQRARPRGTWMEYAFDVEVTAKK